MATQSGMVNPAIFQDLQSRIDEDTAVRDVSRPRAICHVTAHSSRDRNFETSSRHWKSTVSTTNSTFYGFADMLQTAMSPSCCQEPIRHGCLIVSCAKMQTSHNLAYPHGSSRRPQSRRGADQECCRHGIEAVASCVEDALLQIQ